MKQVTGLGDPSEGFLMPDGSKADVARVPGVPDIRQHMQKRMDKAKMLEQVLDLCLAVGGRPCVTVRGIESWRRSRWAVEEELGEHGEEPSEAMSYTIYSLRSTSQVSLPGIEKIMELLQVSREDAELLQDDRTASWNIKTYSNGSLSS